MLSCVEHGKSFITSMTVVILTCLLKTRSNNCQGLCTCKNLRFTVPRRYFFCESLTFLFCLVFAMSLCASVYMCFGVTCWERADLLALVCGVYYEFVTFPLVSWVRCGT